jgi:anti-sigma B factor antagonist
VPDFGVVVELESDALVLGIVGELDAYTAPKLRAALLSLVSTGTTRLVIDLTDLTFVDSTGLNLLVRAGQRVEGLGGSLTLRGATTQTRRLLELTGLDGMFTLESPPAQ